MLINESLGNLVIQLYTNIVELNLHQVYNLKLLWNFYLMLVFSQKLQNGLINNLKKIYIKCNYNNWRMIFAK